jgi:uncharacterized protein (TIGR03437 family)
MYPMRATIRSMAALLVPAILAAASPQIWFCPLDSIFRSRVNYSGSPQYMSLFTPSSPWTQAASHINVFKVYSTWISAASDADLQIQFSDLNRRGIALALEAGAITASSQCGIGVEAQGGQDLVNLALKIQKNGGNLRYLAMDEPIYFFTLYTGSNACQWTVDQMAANVAANLRALRAQFPNVIIGDIEPFPVAAPNWLAQYQAGIEAFRKALGFPLAFFDADVAWDSPGYLADLAAVRGMVASEGLPFGIIYNGSPKAVSDADWIRSAAGHMATAELTLGSPDMVIFQSWDPYPKKLLPETDSDAFTALIDSYFRRRTTLSSSITGSVIQGILTAADTGEPIADVPVDINLSPTAGAGVSALYTMAGTIPVGTQSVVFGARVNLECDCSGSADFLASSFTMDAGATGVLTRDFSNQLNGWGVYSTSASVTVENGSLHVIAQPGQSVLLNSPPLPFTTAVPYTFRVKAQVAPKSAGSGYFALIFLGATGEISRVRIPFAPALVPVATLTTDTLGHYAAALAAGISGALNIQSTFAGDQNDWPAQSTTSWTTVGNLLAAGGSANVAPDSLVSVYPPPGVTLANSTIQAGAPPWPATLGGTAVSVTDAAGVTRSAAISAVSPGQVNYVMPPETALGLATVAITSEDGKTSSGPANVVKVAPGIGILNTQGLVASNIVRVDANVNQAVEPIYQLDPSGNVVARPVNLGPATDQVYLVLYGTGIRGADNSTIRANIGGTDIPVLGAAAQGQYPGVDQINVGPLPQSLAGRGDVSIQISAAGIPANPTHMTIQ